MVMSVRVEVRMEVVDDCGDHYGGHYSDGERHAPLTRCIHEMCQRLDL